MVNKSTADNIPGVMLVSASQVKEELSMEETIGAVENAFKLQALGKIIMPCKMYLDLVDYHGDFRAMPAYIDGAAGIKWVSVFPQNRGRNLPTVMGTIILSDPNTGAPMAVMEGAFITEMRTGASGGIAAKYLARKDSSIIGLIGAGVQAKTQAMAIAAVMPGIKEVKVFDLNSGTSAQFAKEMGGQLKINVKAVDSIEQAAAADVVVTTTPSTRPVLLRQQVKPGTHINAIGADAAGKQELDMNILRDGKIIVDDVEQAAHSGEINVGLAKKMIRLDDIYGTLGQVIAGMKQGRERDDEITVFDSTGLAIQDICCAKLVYERIKLKGPTVFKLL
jgi:alanine dehydrogenase